MKTCLVALYRWAVKALAGGPLSKFKPAIALSRFLAHLLRSDYTEIDGHKMYLDPDDSLLLSIWGGHEHFETQVIVDAVRPGDTVLDIGANIGYYTLLFARQTGPQGTVIAFEPDPDNFALLKKNVEANGYQNVELVQKAVSNENGAITLYLDQKYKGNHRIRPFDGASRSIEIEAVALQDFLKDRAEEIDLIKIDIEGAEPMALESMAETLKKGTTTIVTEFYPKALKECGNDPGAYLAFLTECGFALYEINEKAQKLERASASGLLQQYPVDGQIRLTNLLCKKEGVDAGMPRQEGAS